MVRLSLPLLATTFVAVALAAPLSSQHPFKKIDSKNPTNRQFFELAKPYKPFDNLKKKTTFANVDHVRSNFFLRGTTTPIAPRNCLPDTYAREFQPFHLRNHEFDGFLSKSIYAHFVVAGHKDNDHLLPLKFVVGSYDEDDMKVPGDCIQEDFEYKFQIVEPVQGFVQVKGGSLVIVQHEEDASPLYLHKSAGQGLRIAQHTPAGPLAVAIVYPGHPTTFEKPESKNERQVFDLVATVPSSKKHLLW
ncbi:hypothetical protein CPC16_007315 [Podila verticillata]|nr:hypothetical protein CPC16_007315 [Podila verticillata]